MKLPPKWQCFILPLSPDAYSHSDTGQKTLFSADNYNDTDDLKMHLTTLENLRERVKTFEKLKCYQI